MGILRWLYGKGIAGAISIDLIKKYLAIKAKHPEEDNEKILSRVWNYWLTLNEEHIIAEDGRNKIVRLKIIKDRIESKTGVDAFIKHRTLFDLYQDILYIETEITSKDGSTWHKTMSVFLKSAKQYGLDFSKEYESYKRLIP